MSLKDKCIKNITTKYNKMITTIFVVLIIIVSLFLRLYHLNFGLPHNFYADEPEFVEFAIKYTFEIKDVVFNNNWYKLIPLNYVYGTVPTYILTFFTILFVQITDLLNISIQKINIYELNRFINLLFGFLLAPTIYYLYLKMFKNKFGATISMFLVLFNYKLIVHSHYVNADLFLTSFVLISFYFLYLYYTYNKKAEHNFSKYSLFVVLSAVFFGLAVGTKITSLISLFLFWFIFLSKKDYRSFFAFNFIIFATFMASNPFSVIFFQDFVYRVYSMLVIEAGMVFDSVNYDIFKYIWALNDMVTSLVLLTFIYGIYLRVKQKEINQFDVFLILNLIVYLLFYSMQSRRVDRWLLPVLSVVFLYSAYGFTDLIKIIISNKKLYLKKTLICFFVVSALIYYNYFNLVLLKQFQRYTPKSMAYLWLKDNIDLKDPKNNVLSYTQEGLDPLNKLPYSNIKQVNVYESKGASLFYPENPLNYKYVVMASRPMQNYKRQEVINKYSEYSKRWIEFENDVLNENNFKLIKSFETTKPNLIPLSSVYIFKRVY